jgi:hypothetical protein
VGKLVRDPGASLPGRTAPVLRTSKTQASGSRDDEAATSSASAAASKSEMSKLDPPQVPDDASGLEVDARIAGRYSG